MILDLHIHSKHSADSPIEVATILKLAKKKGLQGVAITDHNTIGGGIEALRINRDPGFVTIVGCEIETTDKVDILGLFLTEEIQSREGNEVLEEIKEQDGVAVWAHPYRGGKNLLPSPLIRRIGVIEGFNAKTLESQNMLARALAEKVHKPVIAVSDAHAAAEIGNAATLIDCSSPDEIKEALLNGQTNLLSFKLSNAQLYDLQFPAKQPA